MLATPHSRGLRIPDFQATFDPVTLAPLQLGVAARDTLVTVHNLSSTPSAARVGFWNEYSELVFQFEIELAGLDVRSFSVAAALSGDPSARLCPHLVEPKYGPFPLAFLSQTLCRLSHGYSPNAAVDGIITNPIHGQITIEDPSHGGTEINLRVDYVTGMPYPASNPTLPNAAAEGVTCNKTHVFLTTVDLHRNGRASDLRVEHVIATPHSAAANSHARQAQFLSPDGLCVVYRRPAWRGLGLVLKESQMKVREAIRLIESDGWYYVTSRGSHRQYKHPLKKGRVTIPGKLSDDLAPGTFNSILKQAGLKG